MRESEKIQQEIDLYREIISAAKIRPASEAVQFITPYLNHDSSEIVGGAIYSLLSILRVKDERFRLKAIAMLQNPELDEGLRIKCIQGLSGAYAGTADKKLLTLLYPIYENRTSSHNYLRLAALKGLLRLIGMDSKTMLKKLGFIEDVDAIPKGNIRKEMDQIASIIDGT
ncbi:MAG: hypothetical protein AAFN81_33260 [Bacteroidota bacterium]